MNIAKTVIAVKISPIDTKVKGSRGPMGPRSKDIRHKSEWQDSKHFTSVKRIAVSLRKNGGHSHHQRRFFQKQEK
jgi:hypothetical protein